ncbi:MAG: YtxH domain-containing protein [Cyclobacteriaceae bacterium]|nr:YtxH domain-containing protein [Cyclobacteriaceae bacterium]
MTKAKSQSPNSNTPKKKNTALKVAGGVLAGAAAGAIAGILMAPDSGKNTRKKIADKSKKVTADVKSKVTEIKGNLAKKKDQLFKKKIK